MEVYGCNGSVSENTVLQGGLYRSVPFPHRIISNSRDFDLRVHDEDNNYSVSTASLQPLPYTSPEMASNFRVPFTSAQWQELEHQALIYKCMISSIPIPHELLTKWMSQTSSIQNRRKSSFNSRIANSLDDEPGRCRRTDGKKWRCSRDAAPDQKYCERHLHRGRPRSRKPVEVHSKINAATNFSSPTSITNFSNLSSDDNCIPPKYSEVFVKSDLKPNKLETIDSASCNYQSRYLDWMRENTNSIDRNNQRETSDSSVFTSFDDNLDPNSSAYNVGVPETDLNNECTFFLNTAPSSIFNDTSLASSLTLSFSHEREMSFSHNQMDHGVGNAAFDNEEKKTQSGWSTPFSWISSSCCGDPLGEILQSSAIRLSSHSASPRVEEGMKSCSILASLSDSSGTSSPT